MNAVQFGRPMMVTNPRCCSDPHVMCERCAAAALSANAQNLAMLGTSLGDRRGDSLGDRLAALVNVQAAEDRGDDLLPLPTMVWTDSPDSAVSEENARRLSVNLAKLGDSRDVDMLPLPGPLYP